MSIAHRSKVVCLATLLGLAVLLATAVAASAKQSGSQTVLPGLQGPVEVVTDRDGVPHIVASNDLDLARVLGFIHARDRYFQMDVTRREVSGTLAELLGAGELGGDIQNRTFGLRRAAERSATLLSVREAEILQAYADGVNAYTATNPLPPEYADLELTQTPPWSVIDTLAIGKAIAASLSLDIDVGPTFTLQDMIQAGTAGGFDGQTLYFQDVQRSAPMDPAATVPDATGGFPFLVKAGRASSSLLARTMTPAQRAHEKLSRSRLLRQAMNRNEFQIGSNEWGVAAEQSATGLPIIANDPHLSLNAPSTFYELHLVVNGDPEAGDMNVSGVGFPGAPGVILGQNERITWGATTVGADVTDTFRDELHVLLPECLLLGAFACILTEGVFHPVEIEFAAYLVNMTGDGIDDNVVNAGLPLEQTLIATIPFRSFGPIVDIADLSVIITGGITDALSVQYTGFHATREVQAFLQWNRAGNLSEFLTGLADFDVGSQNWAYADVDGNLAYFTSAEIPLRKDLEAGMVSGSGPGFIRDGLGDANWLPDPGHSQGQAIPYAILPESEMPHTVNPANGFFANANNDPAGVTLDNDPLNQKRRSNPTAIYYLGSGFSNGLRAGRITRLLEAAIQGGGKVSVQDMQRFQANTQQLDAELMTPFLLQAFEHATNGNGTTPSELASLGADPEIAEAVGRLGSWDFSTPTGIREGYDAHDRWGKRSASVPTPEARASVAATIYNLWRAKAIGSVIDDTLASQGLGVGSGDALKALHHLLSQEPFTGVGASGLEFFSQPAALTVEERRDVTLLAALREALDALASNTFAPAFGNSTDQDDYRWGKLHRIVFDHEFDPASSTPPQAGFEHLSPEMPGLSRDGGYEVVNASGFSARAASLNSFMFGGGPVRRYVGRAGVGGPFGVSGFNVMPGGPSGVPGSPDYATQLGTWLTADYHQVEMRQSPAKGATSSTDSYVPEP
jgi:penicillin amidase